jgi:hypothetical protein
MFLLPLTLFLPSSGEALVHTPTRNHTDTLEKEQKVIANMEK